MKRTYWTYSNEVWRATENISSSTSAFFDEWIHQLTDLSNFRKICLSSFHSIYHADWKTLFIILSASPVINCVFFFFLSRKHNKNAHSSTFLINIDHGDVRAEKHEQHPFLPLNGTAGDRLLRAQTHKHSLSLSHSFPRINSIALVIPGMPRFVRPAKTIIEEVVLAPPTGFLDPRFKRTSPPFSNYCRHWAGASKHETPGREGRGGGVREERCTIRLENNRFRVISPP